MQLFTLLHILFSQIGGAKPMLVGKADCRFRQVGDALSAAASAGESALFNVRWQHGAP